jgi:thiol-disulfide isomerase/thioredoxin
MMDDVKTRFAARRLTRCPRSIGALVLGFAALIALTPAAWAGSLAGLWNATVNVNGTEIPFKIEFSGDGADVKGWFFNGEAREISTSGSFENGSLVLKFDGYLSVLKATVTNGALVGEYRPQRGDPLPIHAVRSVPQPSSNVKAPDISGLWYLEGVTSRKHGEKAFQFFVQQHGAEVTTAILRVDGDGGTLTGSYRDGKFVLSHFSGARPSLVVITPQADGTLNVDQKSQSGPVLTAVRPEQARAKGLDLPVDFDLHTAVKDPTKPFAFAFPDLDGKLVSNTDERFRGKVLLINITGSWCPNCHDEDKFLPQLYNKYRAQGLEIVALDFEEPEQLADPVRLKALVKQNGTRYTVLLAGETGSAKEKLAQAEGWDAWPTTFFVGRDGLVKRVHAGFPSPGSGELFDKTKEEFISEVERLLAANQTSSR